jgi:hypothetical protein
MIIERNKKVVGEKVGNLEYGSVITDVKGNPNSVYIKVKKKCGAGVFLTFTKDHCVLVNLKHGTIREIPGDSYVTVLDSKLIINETETPNMYKKNYMRW